MLKVSNSYKNYKEIAGLPAIFLDQGISTNCDK